MSKRVHFDNLDGLRFLAFLSVFFFHSISTNDKLIQKDAVFIALKDFVSNGGLGVNFFFVLSGFLITYLLFHERSINKSINIKNFYYRRILRIWPLYFACVFFGFVLFPLLKASFAGVPQEAASLFHYLMFLSNFDIINNGFPDASVLSVLWSISVEEQFYLFWPLLLVLFKDKEKYLFVLIILMSLIFRYYNSRELVLYMSTFSVISDMAVGALAAWIIYNDKSFKKKIMYLPKLVIGLSYLVLGVLIIYKNDLFTSPISIVFQRLLFSLFFAFIILEQVFSERSILKIGKFKFISFWGKYTYGLYIWHSVAILITVTILSRVGLHHNALQIIFIQVPLSFVISLIISYISYHYFEKVFLKKKELFSYHKDQGHLKTSLVSSKSTNKKELVNY